MKKLQPWRQCLFVRCARFSLRNSYAGYSVKDGQPYYKLEAKKVYAYTNISSKKVYQERKGTLKNDQQLILLTYYTERIWSRF